MSGVLNPIMLAVTEDRWANEFFGFDPHQRFVVVLVVVGCVTGVIISLAGIAAGVANAVHRRRLEESLKRELLDRGMSADEIVKVVEAAPPPEDAIGRWAASWCKKK
jgi:hypothetical protein